MKKWKELSHRCERTGRCEAQDVPGRSGREFRAAARGQCSSVRKDRKGPGPQKQGSQRLIHQSCGRSRQEGVCPGMCRGVGAFVARRSWDTKGRGALTVAVFREHKAQKESPLSVPPLCSRQMHRWATQGRSGAPRRARRCGTASRGRGSVSAAPTELWWRRWAVLGQPGMPTRH